MAENLKVTHYRNGDSIPNVTKKKEWKNLTNGAYCNYDNKEGNVATYGRLYNWFAVNDSCNIAPAGWHVPSEADWDILVQYLGPQVPAGSLVGGKMKETGTVLWEYPNTGATNETGFSGLPGGYRYIDGDCRGKGLGAFFWSSSSKEYPRPVSSNHALCYHLSCETLTVVIGRLAY